MSILNQKSRAEQEEKLKYLDEEASVFHEEGKYMEELQSLETALMIRRNMYGPDSEQVIRNSVKLCKLCNLLSMAFMEKENFEMALDLLRKAEALSETNLQGRAVTYNNLACYYRRVNKVRTALKYLENSLKIEKSLDLRGSAASDTHLNICAVLSLMDRHEEALNHAMQALILLQEEIILRAYNPDDFEERNDRSSVLVIAYHNIGVQYEFLKKYEDSLNSYQKAIDFAILMLGPDHKITLNVKNVYDSARENVEKTQLTKWKRQQRKLKPYNRDALYKDYEELEKSKNSAVNANYNNFNKVNSRKNIRRDLSNDNFNSYKNRDHRDMMAMNGYDQDAEEGDQDDHEQGEEYQRQEGHSYQKADNNNYVQNEE